MCHTGKPKQKYVYQITLTSVHKVKQDFLDREQQLTVIFEDTALRIKKL